MAYDNRYSNQGNYNNRGGYNNQSIGQRRYPDAQPAEIKPLPVPADYVDEAEKILQEIAGKKGEPVYKIITTSKLRNFIALVMDIYNEESRSKEKELSSESKLKLMRLRVRIVYDAGRDPNTKIFVQKAKLLEYLKGVGNDRESMIRFAHYMEALVAYHRYLGGREN